jgi:hypothetical protein
MKWEGVDWIKLVQDSDKWWAVLKTLIKCWVTYNEETFWTS